MSKYSFKGQNLTSIVEYVIMKSQLRIVKTEVIYKVVDMNLTFWAFCAIIKVRKEL